MSTQEKINLIVQDTNKAYLKFITDQNLGLEYQRISNSILECQGVYTTENNLAASSSALLNMLLRNKI